MAAGIDPLSLTHSPVALTFAFCNLGQRQGCKGRVVDSRHARAVLPAAGSKGWQLMLTPGARVWAVMSGRRSSRPAVRAAHRHPPL